MRLKPASRYSVSFSDVTEDGFASIVISASEAILKAFLIAPSSSHICLLSGTVGVPPPKYTVSLLSISVIGFVPALSSITEAISSTSFSAAL